jgi:ribonuclease T
VKSNSRGAEAECKKFTYPWTVEAAGPVPAIYSMLSLGAVVVEDPKQTFYVELKPVNDKFIPDAMKLVGRSLQDFAEKGCKPKEAIAAFRGWLAGIAKNGKPIFVGFNATFDWAFVNFYFHQYIGENPFGFGGIDIKSYYMGLTGCMWDQTRSSRIWAEFKGSARHTNNALDDAIEQAEMFRRMRENAASGGKK